MSPHGRKSRSSDDWLVLGRNNEVIDRCGSREEMVRMVNRLDAREAREERKVLVALGIPRGLDPHALYERHAAEPTAASATENHTS